MNAFESAVSKVTNLFAQLAAGDTDVRPVLEDAVREVPVGKGKARFLVVTKRAWRRHGIAERNREAMMSI